MKSLLALAFLIAAPLASVANSPETELKTLAAGSWLSYEVPLQVGLRAPCCFSWNDRKASDAACRLDQDDWNFGHRSDRSTAPADGVLRILMRRGGADFDRVHAIGSQCPMDAGSAIVIDAGALPADASVALLERALHGRKERERQQALPAIAYHATSAADAALEHASDVGNDDDLRRDAVFWLAEARGDRGWRHVRALLDRERDDDLQQHMVFAISVSDAAAARNELRALVGDPRSEIAGQAMFWLAQEEDPRTEELARSILARNASDDLHEKTVFALSQLPTARAIPALRSLIEGGGPQAVRKQALFWLAQVDDDAVLPVFDELLGGRR
jgi:hypothetical protein